MVRFPTNSSQTIIEKWLDFSDKKGLQLWSEFHLIEADFLQIQVKNSLKQRLDFPDKKGLQVWSDLFKFQAENR